MNDNAYENVLPARYLKQDENGELIEEQEDLFERVAKNLAVAEACYTDEEVSITPDEIKPDHPRRNKIITEVFDYDPNVHSRHEVEIELTEENAKWVAFDQLVEVAPQRTKEQLHYYANQFQSLMERLAFMPNSPTLMNAGDELQQLSACFVVSPEDDIDDIHQTAKEAAQVFQSGGGMGYGFWDLRPYGDPVGSTGGIASGPITFMRTFDQMCETIAQGGARRGAQMGVMRVSHPDVIQFIHAKNKDVALARTLRLNDPDDFTHTSFADALEEARELIDDEGRVPEHLRNAVEGHLSNFNISVGITEDFMNAVQNGEEYTFTNPRTGDPHIATPETKELYDLFGLGEYVEVGRALSIPAEEIWEDMVEGAHQNGEPGVVFLDKINEEHSFDVDPDPYAEDGRQEFAVRATNPCGEQPLMEYEACNLGHVNLSTLAAEDRLSFDEYEARQAESFDQLSRKAKSNMVSEFLQRALDTTALEHRARTGARMLDNVVTMSNFPVEEIEETVRKNRKTGVGIMGLAQLFVQLGLEYGSEEADLAAEEIMRLINRYSSRQSQRLANKRGVFENWEESKFADADQYEDWINRHTGEADLSVEDGAVPIRNHNTTTIAPTGTTSMVGNTSGGCEPIYSVANYKNVSDDVQGDEMLVQFDSLFLQTLEENDIDVEATRQEAIELMGNNEFDGASSLSQVPDEIADLFVTTGELSAKQHASIQCALQNYVDSAISKTVNAPNEDTLEDTKEAFEYVYENGGKGVTYYRDGTRTKQVKTTRKDNQDVDEEEEEETAEKEVLESESEESEEVSIGVDVSQQAQITSVDEVSISPQDRPDRLRGETCRVQTGYGKMHVTVNFDGSAPFEVFATIGKSGGVMESACEAIARLASLNLRSGVDVDEVIDQLEGIQSEEVAWHNGQQINSIADGIAYALKQLTGGSVQVNDIPREDEQIETVRDGGAELSEEELESVEQNDKSLCPECGSYTLIQVEGCNKCESCGYSKC
jgi:ribonucleoside-diphosphate reductase alpha chain